MQTFKPGDYVVFKKQCLGVSTHTGEMFAVKAGIRAMVTSDLGIENGVFYSVLTEDGMEFSIFRLSSDDDVMVRVCDDD